MSLVLHVRLPFRAVERLLAFCSWMITGHADAPHWTTIRLWMLRFGLYMLTCPKEKASDWVWICDHTVQAGTDKCMVILGIRLAFLPQVGTCLCLADLQLILLEPVKKSNKEVVYQQLAQAEQVTGPPRLIVSDQGGDLHAGIQLYLQSQPETSWIYDIVHKAANLLKRHLENDERWQGFLAHVGKTNQAVKQTELSFLAPPTQRIKARYMNLEKLVRWAAETLIILKNRPAEILHCCTMERMEEKLGWLREYEQEIEDWSNTMNVIHQTEKQVREEGYHEASEEQLKEHLKDAGKTKLAGQVKEELLTFVREQASKVRPGERLPGTSESIESAFGKWKSFTMDGNRSGFTSLLLILGAVVSKCTPELVREGLSEIRTKHVQRWCEEKLGRTLQSLRRMAYAPFRRDSAQQKPEEAIPGSI